MRDSITLDVHYDTPLDLSGSTVIGLSQSGRTPDVSSTSPVPAAAARFTVAITNDPGLRSGRLPPRRRSRSATGDRAGGRRNEDVRQHARGARPARGHVAGRGAELRGRTATYRRATRRFAAPLRARSRGAVGAVLVHGAHVRDRPRHRVRDCTRDRAEAARDLPRGGRAADRDGSLSWPGRRSRPVLSRVGDCLSGRDALDRAGGRSPYPRHGGDVVASGTAAGEIPAASTRCRCRRCSRRSCRLCSPSSPASSSRLRSRSPGASTRMPRTA